MKFQQRNEKIKLEKRYFLLILLSVESLGVTTPIHRGNLK